MLLSSWCEAHRDHTEGPRSSPILLAWSFHQTRITWCMDTRRTHDSIIPSLWRQNDVGTTWLRHYGVMCPLGWGPVRKICVYNIAPTVPFSQEIVWHYGDVIMGAMASQITSLTIVYSTVYSGADQRKHQSSASLAFGRGIRRWSVNSPHKGPVTRKIVSIWWRHHYGAGTSLFICHKI